MFQTNIIRIFISLLLLFFYFYRKWMHKLENEEDLTVKLRNKFIKIYIEERLKNFKKENR